MLEDMTMLLDTLREILNDMESKISLVKKAVSGSAHGIDISYEVKSLNQNPFVARGVPTSWRIFCVQWSSISRLHTFRMVRKS